MLPEHSKSKQKCDYSDGHSLIIVVSLAIAVLGIGVHYTCRSLFANAEQADTITYLYCLFAIGLLVCLARWQPTLFENKTTSLVILIGAFLFVCLTTASFATLTILPSHAELLWFGYGPRIAMVGVLCTFGLKWLYDNPQSCSAKTLSVLSWSIVLCLYMISVVQPPWAVIDWYHASYIINELLGPQNGLYPLINFSAQYTSFLGYCFSIVFSSGGSVDDAIWFLTVLAVLTVGLAVAGLATCFPKGRKYLAVLLAVPAVFIVKQPEDFYSGSMSVLFQSLPVRLLFPSIVVCLLSVTARQNSRILHICIGITLGLAIVNNAESGLVALFATHVICFMRTAGIAASVKLSVIIASSAIATIVLFVVGLYTFDRGVEPMRLFDFVLGFGSGFGAIAMPTFGLWVAVIGYFCLSAGIAVSYFGQIIKNTEPYEMYYGRKARSASYTLFWALFGLGMFPYYVNRSVVSGQLQFILFPLFFSCAGAFALTGQLRTSRSWLASILLLAAALPGGISVASLVLQSPSVSLNWTRLLGGEGLHPSYIDKYEAGQNEIKIIKNSLRLDSKDTIGLLSDLGAIYANNSGVSPLFPLSALSDSGVVNSALEEIVSASLARPHSVVIVPTRSLPLQQYLERNMYELLARHDMFSVYRPPRPAALR
jgi:hypothetical protein